jgi:uncharacterized protein with FMN-binding domain
MKQSWMRAAAIAALSIGSLLFGLQTANAAAQTASGALKDGTYTGKRVNAYYGFFRVQAVVSGGKLANVVVLEYPNGDRRSQEINSQVLPYLVKQAVSAQSYKVDAVTGATFTVRAFMNSLRDALKAAGA